MKKVLKYSFLVTGLLSASLYAMDEDDKLLDGVSQAHFTAEEEKSNKIDASFSEGDKSSPASPTRTGKTFPAVATPKEELNLGQQVCALRAQVLAAMSGEKPEEKPSVQAALDEYDQLTKEGLEEGVLEHWKDLFTGILANLQEEQEEATAASPLKKDPSTGFTSDDEEADAEGSDTDSTKSAHRRKKGGLGTSTDVTQKVETPTDSDEEEGAPIRTSSATSTDATATEVATSDDEEKKGEEAAQGMGDPQKTIA